MKRVKIYSTLLALTLATLSVACMNDDGCDVMSEINNVTISNIEERYDKSYLDILNINPTIECSMGEASPENLEYKWYFCMNPTSYNDHKHELISTEKELNYKIEVQPGAYNMFLQVTDKQTELKYEHHFQLGVSSPFVRGFYLYGDKNDGTVGIDFISMPIGQDTTVMADIFVNTAKIKGAKDLIFTGHSDRGFNALWAITNDGQYSVEYSSNLAKVDIIDGVNLDDNIYSTLSSIQTPMHLANIAPGTYGPECVSLSGNARIRLVITENEIFTGNMALSEAYGNPINRYSSGTEELFKPYASAFYSGAESAVNYSCFFDMSNHCFVRPANKNMSSATSCEKFADSESPFYFDQNNYTPVRQIVYGENGMGNDGRSYTLMNDANGNYYIYSFTAPADYFTEPTKHYAKEVDMSIATDIEKASFYTFFSEQMILIYSVGNVLYAYDYNRNDIKKYELDAPITYLAMENHSTLTTTDFVVATYNETNKGKIQKYTIADNVNNIEITPKDGECWQTDLKVVKVLWKFSNF